ncbi:MAG: ATP-binding cassette domain-containing protein, partial [Syntrophomonas sp.]
LELIGLTKLRMENPAKLSGGQKQLVALGGVLTLSPDIIVLDETMSQLDAATQDRIKSVLLALKQQGKTLIMIEHEKKNIEIADQTWLLDRGKLIRMSCSGELNGNA